LRCVGGFDFETGDDVSPLSLWESRISPLSLWERNRSPLSLRETNKSPLSLWERVRVRAR